MNVAIITSSDSGYAGTREDLSGPIIEKMVTQAGYTVIKKLLLPDERDILSKAMSDPHYRWNRFFPQRLYAGGHHGCGYPACPRHSRSHAGSQYENYSKGNALKGRGGDS